MLFHLKADKHRYTFRHMIETDGVGCSILLVRRDLAGKRMIRFTKCSDFTETYIDELSEAELADASTKAIIAIDPNMSDLLFCVNGDTKESTRHRYTQNTRRTETKSKKYRKTLQGRKTETVIKLEAELSAFNRKAMHFVEYQKYLAKKIAVYRELSVFYQERIYRKLKLGSYMRRQIVEYSMLKRFKQIFGGGEEVVICIDDWEQRKHR